MPNGSLESLRGFTAFIYAATAAGDRRLVAAHTAALTHLRCARSYADLRAPARAALEARGAEVVLLSQAAGRVDLSAVLCDLGRRGINELHVEAGAVLNGALIQARLVDEFLVYVAPLLVGPGRDFAGLTPLARLQDGLHLRWRDVTRVGADLRMLARVAEG